MSTSVVDRALALANYGLLVFPVASSKAPTCPHGMNAATTDECEVRALWRAYPGPLIGVRTGAATGIDCLDLDTTRHAEAEAWHAHHAPDLPATRTHQSRSGGVHLLFRHMPGLRCSTSRLARGVDVKADAGCLTWWPAAGLPVPIRGPIAAWPDWLAELLIEPLRPCYRADIPPPLPTNAGRRARYLNAAVRSSIERVATAGEGQRNHVLNATTFALARFVAAGELTVDDVREAMTVAARVAGLPPREALATVESALRSGRR